jgi:hypothetical protein
MANVSIIDTTIDNACSFVLCGYKSKKKEGFPEKFNWLKTHAGKGDNV